MHLVPWIGWRPPEAPRPSRTASRGTAALLALLLVSAAAPPPRAGMVLELEESGRPICTTRPLDRVIDFTVPDGNGGLFLVIQDWVGGTVFGYLDDYDVSLIHLDADLDRLPVGDLYLGDDPCGPIVIGGYGVQRPTGALSPAPGVIVIAAHDEGPLPDFLPTTIIVRILGFNGEPAPGWTPWRPDDPARAYAWPTLMPDGAGGFYMAWSESPAELRPKPLLMLQRLGPDGLPAWEAPLRVAEAYDVAGESIAMAPDGEGGLYLTWADGRTAPGSYGYDPWITRISGDGLQLWGDGGLRILEGGDASLDVSLVPLGDEGAIVVFSDGRAARAQRFSAGGGRLWGSAGIRLSPADATGLAEYPLATAGPDGSLYVSWAARTGSFASAPLWLQRLGNDGTLLWPAPVLITDRIEFPWTRRQTLMPDGALALAFSRAVGLPIDIFAQTVDRRGRIKAPPGGSPVGVWETLQGVPHVLPPLIGAAGDGAALSATYLWGDKRVSSAYGVTTGLFAQRAHFFSAPLLHPAPAAALPQGTEAILTVDGDDLQSDLRIDAGAGIIPTSIVVQPGSVEGPGDRLTLTLRIDEGARPGSRSLTLSNPDGGRFVAQDRLRVIFNPLRIDVDRSGRVDGFDLAVLARAFGSREGDESYALAADIDASGLVDGADLALMASRFGGPAVP